MNAKAKKLLVATAIPASNRVVETTDNQPRVLDDLTNPPAATPLPSDISIRKGKWAAETADKLNDDDSFSSDLVDSWESEEKAKRAPAQMLIDLQKVFTVEELRTFPLPTVKISGKEGISKSHPLYGRSFEYETTKTGKDGTTKNAYGDYYKDLAAKLDAVKNEQEWCDYWRAVIADPAKARSEHIGWVKNGKAASELDLHDGRVKSAVKLVKNAMRVFFKMDAINTRMPQLECSMQMRQVLQDGKPIYLAADGTATFDAMTGTNNNTPITEITGTKKPINICTRNATGKDYMGEDYTVGGFLQFDVDEAIKQGGTFAALISTAKREGEESDPDGHLLPDVKKDTRDEYLINLARYMKDGNHTELLLKELANGKLAQAVVVAIEAIRAELDIISNTPAFSVELAKLKKEHDGRSTEAWLQRKSA